nr:hypothetical protein [Tanacetum cinerariifolium]
GDGGSGVSGDDGSGVSGEGVRWSRWWGQKMGVVAGGIAWCRRLGSVAAGWMVVKPVEWQRRQPGSGWWVAVWGRRVEGSDIDDWIDRSEGNNFEFSGKSPPENSGGGGVMVAGRRQWWPAVGGVAGNGREYYYMCVCIYFVMK